MTFRYVPTVDFADALKAWSGRPLFDMPADQSPCGHLVGAAEENRVLADTFARLCALDTSADRMTFLMGVIDRHKRYVRLYEGTVRGESNPRRVGANASREAWARIKPIEAMIDVLEQWRDELQQTWSAEIGVGFIDEAARARA